MQCALAEYINAREYVLNAATHLRELRLALGYPDQALEERPPHADELDGLLPPRVRPSSLRDCVREGVGGVRGVSTPDVAVEEGVSRLPRRDRGARDPLGGRT